MVSLGEHELGKLIRILRSFRDLFVVERNNHAYVMNGSIFIDCPFAQIDRSCAAYKTLWGRRIDSGEIQGIVKNTNWVRAMFDNHKLEAAEEKEPTDREIATMIRDEALDPKKKHGRGIAFFANKRTGRAYFNHALITAVEFLIESPTYRMAIPITKSPATPMVFYEGDHVVGAIANQL